MLIQDISVADILVGLLGESKPVCSDYEIVFTGRRGRSAYSDLVAARTGLDVDNGG
jgi:hypothetical protein